MRIYAIVRLLIRKLLLLLLRLLLWRLLLLLLLHHACLLSLWVDADRMLLLLLRSARVWL